MYNFKNLIGKKFGRLTVLKRTGNVGKKTSWICKCSCGNEKIAQGYLLKIGNTKSCGCLKREKTIERNKKGLKIESPIKELFARYGRRAFKRRIEFYLTYDHFKKIISGKCHYCGISSSNVFYTNSHIFKYNGIDRVDNKQGYSSSNTVSCCANCNISKMDMSEKEFYDWVVRIFLNLKNKKHIS